MNIAIRYQSRGGHVKEMAEIIAKGVGVEPISIDDPRAPLTEHVDLLIIGGALYKFALDPSMEEYLSNLPDEIASKAIVFGSSLLSHRPVLLIKERLKAHGIETHPSAMWMRGKPKAYLHEIGVPWAAREAKKIEKELYGDANDEEQEASAEPLPEEAASAESVEIVDTSATEDGDNE